MKIEKRTFETSDPTVHNLKLPDMIQFALEDYEEEGDLPKEFFILFENGNVEGMTPSESKAAEWADRLNLELPNV